MKNTAAMFAVIAVTGLFAGSASAKTVWDQIAESAPLAENPSADIEMTAPRSVFTDLQTTAPLAQTFDTLANTAP
jgi:hypothetical protein